MANIYALGLREFPGACGFVTRFEVDAEFLCMRGGRNVNQDAIAGSLLGTAVGDAIGLPYEGLPPRRATRLLGRPDRYRLLFGHGMVSDDTEHSCMVAEALLASGGNVEIFRNRFAWSLRFWLLGLPAGVGLATARAIVRLWLGFGPIRSGVFSAGNGPAMRAAILGAAIDDEQSLYAHVQVSTRITHTDPKAFCGAMAVALAAQMARQTAVVQADEYLLRLERLLGADGSELLGLLRKAAAAAQEGRSTKEFAQSIGQEKGVTGYVMDTVPVAIHAWLSHQADLRAAIIAVVECGGDADTTAAITGGIVGAGVGRSGIPENWLKGLCEWPLSVRRIEALAVDLANAAQGQKSGRQLGIPFPLLWPRNLFFLGVVLMHGLRRVLPPY